MTWEVSLLLLGIQWSNQTIFFVLFTSKYEKMCDPNSLFQLKEKMLSSCAKHWVYGWRKSEIQKKIWVYLSYYQSAGAE